MLPFFLAVVAAYAYIVIAGKFGLQLLKLALETLLGTEYLEIMKPDELCQHRIAASPAVALHGILMVFLTEIIRSHIYIDIGGIGACCYAHSQHRRQ